MMLTSDNETINSIKVMAFFTCGDRSRTIFKVYTIKNNQSMTQQQNKFSLRGLPAEMLKR